jgi:thioredoxin reductase
VVTVTDELRNEYDVVVVGGGAAGLNGALMLARSRRSVVVVDAGAPRNAPAAGVHGLLAREGMPPGELLARGRAEVRSYGGSVVEGEVVRADRDGDEFVVGLADGRTVRARRLLVTTGLVDELPDVPGLRERWGRDVLHCPYCHGWEVRDEPLGVLGTNPMSVQHALLVRQWSDDVMFFSHTCELLPEDEERLSARDIGIVRGEVARLVVEDDVLRGVELVGGEVIRRAAVFVRPVLVPRPGGLLSGMGCATDGAGFPVVDATGRTSCPGVWASGNAADPRAQVITAAGAGSAAAIALNADLVEEDVVRAMSERSATRSAPR